MDYQVVLFYKYVKLEDPTAIMLWIKSLCEKYEIKCRIIVAREGINGTFEGIVENNKKFTKELKQHPLFKDIWFKRASGDGKSFPKINVKVRQEIVTLGLKEEDFDPTVTTGKYITADELQALYESGEEFYVVDMRNDYEHNVGYFENSIKMPLSNFRDLPEKLSEIEHLKHKKVISVCTGGIRCEKASGFLVNNGFTNVYQLYGGIQTYMQKYPNQKFKGKLYVFDGRVVWGVNVNDPEHEIVGECEKCHETTDNYVDCEYIHCKGHRHLVICKNCYDENGHAFCSDECKAKFYAMAKVEIAN
jgi:UPF0176 protein